MSRVRSPSPAPLDDDDLLPEILLRLPPQPSSLPRASLVSKRWRSVASDPAFSRRFRRHHRRNPPLLGFFRAESGPNFLLRFEPTLDAPNRVSPERLSWRGIDDDDRYYPLGCRHGLVLILNSTQKQVLVWDPVTGDQHRVAIPPGFEVVRTLPIGAVLRGAGDGDHFQVVLVGNSEEQITQVLGCVYSSETGAWGDHISTSLRSKDLGYIVVSVGVGLRGGLFTIQLKSLKFEKLLRNNTLGYFHSFESVYAAGIGGGAGLLHNP